ncbi:MAG: phosphoglycerate dehydrogenase [Bacilli bacterium]|nr:phosphoglycerate dehydrogenase [Bacilli bacterium]
MYNIKYLNPISEKGKNLLTEKYKETSELSDAALVMVRSAAMHDLELPKGLDAIARAGAGVNNIPIDKCAEQGIVVFNTPGANANGVKELVVAGMLLAARDIVGGINWVNTIKGEKDIAKLVEKGKAKFSGTEVLEKAVGVIGLGAIGILVANALVGLGMTVYGYDPFISIDHAWSLSRSVIHAKNIDEVYENCDYITVHVPLIDETKGMINKDTIAKMKKDVVVLNFARDSLVNDTDMEVALKEGKVKKYVTDFPNDKTAGMSGVIAIPHLGASTEESEDNCAVMAIKQAMDYIENGNIMNSVNYPNCDAGICTTEGRIAICHKNVPNMINQLTTIFNGYNINISNMINKSKGNFAYTLFDIDAKSTLEIKEKLEKVNSVLKVRILK